MIRVLRKYHRTIAIAACLPLILTVVTGVAYTLFDKWLGLDEIGYFMLELHTMKILGLDSIYPLLNGLGLVGLIVTGLSMSGLLKKRHSSTV
jgi:hypothetical protein